MNFCKFVDVVSFAHFIRILEDSGYKYQTNTITKDCFEIIVEFWKDGEV